MMEGRVEPQDITRVGGLLRAGRGRAGLEIDEVARYLHIRPSFLRAIEAGRFGQLPGSVYAIGFVRAYAELLGLDADDVVRRFRDEATELDIRRPLQFPRPVAEAGTPKGGVLLLGAIMAVLAYATWYASTTSAPDVAELVSPVPERLAPASGRTALEADARGTAGGGAAEKEAAGGGPVPAPVGQFTRSGERTTTDDGPAGRAGAPAAGAAGVGTPGVGTPGGVGTALPPLRPAAPSDIASIGFPAPGTDATGGGALSRRPGIPSPSLATPGATSPMEPPPGVDRMVEAASAPPVPPPAAGAHPPAPAPTTALAAEPPDGALPTVTDAGTRIVLRAKSDSWVEVRDGQTKTLLAARLLRAGDVYRVPDRPGLRLVTGNAGGLVVVVDGEIAPSLGGDGVVRRGVPLDAETLRRGVEATGPQ